MNSISTITREAYPYLGSEAGMLAHCTLCPRECGVNRFSAKLGYCRSDAAFRVASVCAHKGEEPVISGKKGICNIFFPHCNLQCVFCQNHEISRNKNGFETHADAFDRLIDKICQTLDRTENIVGFVSPSHYIPQMLAIIRGIKAAGRNPVFVYNTNAYDKPETIRMLEGAIDVYLPDFKYSDPELAFRYSKAKDYPETALAAIKEMYRQKGSTLIVNENGIAESGLIVRHLVLPGAVEQSIEALRQLGVGISFNLHISLMSQYYPAGTIAVYKDLNRPLYEEEYLQVVDAFHEMGFYRGWIQEMDSHANYRPDFSKDIPFEDQKCEE